MSNQTKTALSTDEVIIRFNERDRMKGTYTSRPTSDGAEDWLNQSQRVLDHGLVVLTDYMGSDYSIEEAARISYGAGTRKATETQGLINYLILNAHTSPFEMAEAQFYMRMPIFVMRQHIRHRTACLSGDTVLNFHRRHITIKEFHDKWHQANQQKAGAKKKDMFVERIQSTTLYTVPELAKLVERWDSGIRTAIRGGRLKAHAIKCDGKKQTYVRGSDWLKYAEAEFYRPVNNVSQQLSNWNLRHLNEDTLEVDYTNVVDVWESGIKSTYTITLSDGTSIRATKDHRFFTDAGWLTLKELWSMKHKRANAKLSRSIAKGANSHQSFDVEIGDDEEWRFVRGTRKKYEISSYGRLRSHKWGRTSIKKPHITEGGYVVYSIQMKDGSQVTQHGHKLVLDHFDRPSKEGEQCRHKDGNRRHNHVSNLEWGSSQENSLDMVEHNNSTTYKHFFVDVVNVEYYGEEMTYDLEVASNHHNFSANGVIVHNSVNEYSGRYSVMPNTFFVPNLADIRRQSLINKQGSAEALDVATAESVRDKILSHSQKSYALYEELLAAGDGVSREMARIILPLNIYTELYWKMDLHNLMHYINLRADSHAQPQAQAYANALLNVVAEWVPMTYNAFVSYRQKVVTLGESSVKAVAELIELGVESWDSIKDKYKLSKSEAADLETLFKL